VKPVDEDDLEDDVQSIRRHDDLQRPAQVRDASQVALPGERDEGCRQSERADSEVEERELSRMPVAAEAAEERRRERLTHRDQHHTDRERDPERLCGKPRRPLVPACTARAGDDGRRPVGQEVEDRERACEHRPGEPERGQLRPTEMADDRRVDEHVQRLGGERAERR